MTKAIRTVNVQVQLGTAFWLLIILVIGGGVLLAVLGPKRLTSAIEGGFRDAFRH